MAFQAARGLPSAHAGHLWRSGGRIAGHRAVLTRGKVREGGPPAVRGRERLLFLPCDAQRVDDVACGALPHAVCPQPQVKPPDGS